MQVTEQQYEREYAHRIRTFNRHSSDESVDNNSEHGNGPQNEPYANDNLHHHRGDESSPNGRLRGPPLKLNQNQVFFSP